MGRIRTLLFPAAAVITIVFATTSCAAQNTTPAAPPAATSMPTPSPSESAPLPSTSGGAAFNYPDTTDTTQLAIYLKYENSSTSGDIIVGPSAMTADRPFTVEAQCEGDVASFEVVTADKDKRVLVAGDLICDEPSSLQTNYQLPYSGPVQVNLINAENAGRAWVRVIQP